MTRDPTPHSEQPQQGEEPGQAEDVPYLLEMYKFAVDMADRVASRRGTANNFFLTVNAALTAFIGILGGAVQRQSNDLISDRFSAVIIAVVGIVFSLTWWVLLRSYRDLSQAKWDVIARIEDRLAIRPFQDEWKVLKAEQPRGLRGRYIELSVVERVVPIIFLILYIALAVRIGTA
ncbi:MAG: hypothetical protein WD598_11555 [Acidimicrobiia bacterium]